MRTQAWALAQFVQKEKQCFQMFQNKWFAPESKPVFLFVSVGCRGRKPIDLAPTVGAR